MGAAPSPRATAGGTSKGTWNGMKRAGGSRASASLPSALKATVRSVPSGVLPLPPPTLALVGVVVIRTGLAQKLDVSPV